MKIAYITNCFGSQSHTFIRREIHALRALGVDISLLGVRRDYQNCAPDAQALVEETQYLYPISFPLLIKLTLQHLLRSPKRYLCGAYLAMTEEEFTVKRRLKMLYHFIVSVVPAQEITTRGITHIHAHFMNASASIAMYAAYHANIPYSITVHSAGTYQTPHILGVKQKLKNAQFLVMISRYNISYFDDIEPCKHKSFVVRCGMDIQDFPFRAGITPRVNTPIQMLGVGRFVEKKGFEYLIRACHILSQSGFPFSLRLIGDGPLMEPLNSLTSELGLKHQIVFEGKKSTDQVRAAMQSADIVVVPSVTSASGEMEGLPVVIMEAMALGTPVIATNHSGIPEIVIANQTGELVPEKDPNSLSEAIQRVASRSDNSHVFSAKELLDSEFNILNIAQLRKRLFEKVHED